MSALKDTLETRSVHISKIIIAVLGLLASLNLFWVASKYSHLYQSIEAGIKNGGSAPLIDQSVVRRDWTIEGALLIATVSLLFRRVIGIVVSLTSLIWIGIEYMWWYIWTQRAIEAAGLTQLPFGVPQAGGFAGATKWNLAILAITAALVLWETRILIRCLSSRSAPD